MNDPSLRHHPADRATREVIGAIAFEARLRPVSKAGAQLARDLPWFTPSEKTSWEAHTHWLRAVDAWATSDRDLVSIKQDLTEVPLLDTVSRRLAAREVLRDADFFTLKRFCYHAARLLEQSRSLAGQEYPLQGWIDWIDRTCQHIHPEKQRTPRFHLSDALSKELAAARKNQRALARSMRRSAGDVEDALRADYPGVHINLDGTLELEQADRQRATEDKRLEQRDGQWRIAELSEDRAALDELERELAAIEAEVRQTLTQQLEKDAASMEEIAAFLASVDLGLAAAELRRHVDGSWPEWSEETLATMEACHDPRISNAQRVSLETDQHPTLITGPNMGGKSSLLEVFGLCQWCMQRGLPVPAKLFRAPPVEAIVYTGSDEPDSSRTSEGLSSFGREVRRLVDARRTASPMLWLLDELGRGTHPEEGAALAREVIEAFHARGDRVLASTHFPELARMPGCDLWRISGLDDREQLEELLDESEAPESLERALRAAMDYRPKRIDHPEDAIPRDAHLIAKLLGW